MNIEQLKKLAAENDRPIEYFCGDPNAGTFIELREALNLVIPILENAPRGCQCHVSDYDGYYGTKHLDRCKAYMDAWEAFENEKSI